MDKRLERREEISLALMEAIEGLMISLVIFSKDYASLMWCLEELVKIIKCKETNQLIIIIVFYNIDPSDVRHQRGSYVDAFAKHEEKFKHNIDKLQIWRSTLTKTANLSRLVEINGGRAYHQFKSISRISLQGNEFILRYASLLLIWLKDIYLSN
ncbi:TMV resistance protein N-like [Prosopis cineraria]|uniref:TMV resistance protein N-like n=1 Tax=Prosopis cineraria TaxID=364024 RepID=UPI00241097C3|nr:TMV resistance protein N-like [Prosopis cineraria]